MLALFIGVLNHHLAKMDIILHNLKVTVLFKGLSVHVSGKSITVIKMVILIDFKEFSTRCTQASESHTKINGGTCL